MSANSTDHRAEDRKAAIGEVLEAGMESPFDEAAASLLRCLGYASERTLAGQTGDVDDFLAQWPLRSVAPATQTQSEGKFRASAASVLVLFQVADEEIRDQHQGSLLAETDFKDGLQKSFVFLAVELSGTSYSRTDYADFAREINKRLAMPAFVLFRADGGSLTLAFVHRRKHKRDRTRQVLGNVALIREIDPSNPHRAHLDILAELSLQSRLAWMGTHAMPTNFDGLLAALLDTLDTQELNKRFYRDLFGWFKRAVEEAAFPSDQPRTLSPEEHVIRLLTRLLFVWFIKEKKLIAEELFVEEQVGKLLKGYDTNKGDSYYRAILQNLFFATLNCEVEHRGWSQRQQSTHRLFDRYRYRKEIEDPHALLKLFARTPFINGGLFDCLDSVESLTQGGYRIDCFSDNVTDKRRKEYGIVSIPNRLFFDDKEGLVTLFNRYKFTVEENTPAEVEVALDPELLGRVFENLLAAYNPETRETARKQTGSYYTPRPVVDYMVDEALVASLALKAQPADGDQAFWRDRLHYLLDYEDAFGDASDLFEESETDGVIRAIADLKVLDPACGSGAFPMGILHKLTLALRRLDPANARWERLQKELAQKRAAAAFDTHDQGARDAELTEISATFERYRGSDFGRKLFLIQNSIFGVDIQPVACQIAKLRFFISLAIEQEVDDTAPNHGVKPLPNLEARFVAADTLLGLQAPGMKHLVSIPTIEVQRQLRNNREHYFHARTRGDKMAAVKEDTRLRLKLVRALETSGLPAVAANRLAKWNPYDQSATADWFDAEHMFGVPDGFDVVVGNPPYVQLQKNKGKLRRLYEDCGFETFTSTGDVYQLFIEKGCRLLHPSNGILAYITSNSWLKATSGEKTRRFLARHHRPLQVIEMGKDVFNAIVDTCVLAVREGRRTLPIPAVDMDRVATPSLPPADTHWGEIRPSKAPTWGILTVMEWTVFDKMLAVGTRLKDWDIRLNLGIKTGCNEAFVIDGDTKHAMLAANPASQSIIRPVVRGRDVRRWLARTDEQWLLATHNGYDGTRAIEVKEYPAVERHLNQFAAKLKDRQDQGKTPYNLRDCAYQEDFDKEKLFWMDLTEAGRFAYAGPGVLCLNSAYILSGPSIKYLCAVLNSRLITWFMQKTTVTSGMGVPRWFKVTVEQLPIPEVGTSEEAHFVALVDEILRTIEGDPEADVREVEAEIDRLVYDLYQLDETEIAAVEAALGDVRSRAEEDDEPGD